MALTTRAENGCFFESIIVKIFSLRLKAYLVPLLLFSGLLFVYFSNMRYIPAGDSTPTRLLPVSIIKEGDFDLDEFNLPEKAWYIREINGRVLSQYPIFPALMALPIYLVPTLFTADVLPLVPLLGKISSALFVATASLVLFLLLKQITGLGNSLIITLIFALATNNWSTSSQALLQHGPGEFFIVLSLYFLFKARKNKEVIPLSGLFMATAYSMRPIHAIAVIVLGCYVILKYRKHKVLISKYVLLSLIPVALVFIYNFFYFDNIFGGYGMKFRSEIFPVKSFFGLLFSPSRGLFTYSPILLFSIPGMILALRKKDALYVHIFIIVVAYLLVYTRWYNWWGGWSYGPRLLTDVLPFLMLFFVPLLSNSLISQKAASKLRFLMKAGFTATFAVSFLISVGVQAVGAYKYNNSWNVGDYVRRGAPIDHFPDRLTYWHDSQLYFYLRLLDPFNTNFRKGRMAIKRNDLGKAKKCLKKELKYQGKNVIARFLLANILEHSGEYDKATKEYEYILECYPEYKPALRQVSSLEGERELINSFKIGASSIPKMNWSVFSNYNHKSTYEAVDSDLQTRWTTGTPQRPGMYFQLQFGNVIEFSRIFLYHGALGDFPRELTITLCDRKGKWREIYSAKGKHGIDSYLDIKFKKRFSGKRIRFIQKGRSKGNWWSIHEIYIE